MKTDVKAIVGSSKFGLGDSPMGSYGSTIKSLESNFTLCPKSSMPKSAKMRAEIRSKIEKVLTSFMVTIILASISLKLVQLRANLKTLNKRTPLNADSAELLP